MTRVVKTMIAMLAVLLLGMVGGFILAAGAQELPEDILYVEMHKYETYVFTPNGYRAGRDTVEHKGAYFIYGRASEDIVFTSNNGEAVTYDVIFHSLEAVADTWYGICSIDAGVTLNITVYGDNKLIGYNHSGLTMGEEYKDAPLPIVNLTIMENSKIQIGFDYELTEYCVSPKITVNINKEAESNLDMSSEGWRANETLVLSRGEEVLHKYVYTYVDDEICKRTCDSCDYINLDEMHDTEYTLFEETDENYAKKHSVKCVLCKHDFGDEDHKIRYWTNEEKHQLFCDTCGYAEESVSHSLNEDGCTVCGNNYTVSHTVNDETTKYLLFETAMGAARETGGCLKLLSDVEMSFGERIEAVNYDLTIDLAGFKLNGVSVKVGEGITVNVIDSSELKTGEWSASQYSNCMIRGTLLIEKITVTGGTFYLENLGALTIKDTVVKNESIITHEDNFAVELTGVIYEDELKITTRLDRLQGIKIENCSFGKITTGSAYGEYISVNALIGEGYAYEGANGILDGSKNEISGVVRIVEHTEHTENKCHSDEASHWMGCECGYASATVEKEAHTVDENAICPVCEGEIVALVVGGTDGIKYFTTVEAAFDYANAIDVSEVRLQRDTTFEELTVMGNITLNLNGYKLESIRNRVIVYGKLAIIDKSDSKTGLLASNGEDAYILTLQVDATLDVIGGEIHGMIYSLGSYDMDTVITISGGKFVSSELFRLGKGTVVKISGGVFECAEAVFNLGWGDNISISITGGIFVNSRIIMPQNETLLPSLDDILGEISGCGVVSFISETGTPLTIEDVSEYYEGVIVAAHQGSVLESDGEYHWYTCLNCGISQPDIKHTRDYELSAENAELHNVSCVVCTKDLGTEQHSGEGTCTSQAICIYCEAFFGEMPKGHIYDNACDTECNNCTVGQREVEDHKYENDCDADCNICGLTREVSDHKYDNACDTNCNVCGKIREISHSYGQNGKCSVCNASDPNYQPPSSGTNNSGTNNSTGTSGKEPQPNGEGGGIGTGAVIGIVAGSVVALGGGIFALFWFVIRKKRI